MPDDPSALELYDSLLLARARGRGPVDQVRDLLALSLAGRGVRVADYFWFAMYEDDWAPEEMTRVIGDRAVPELVRASSRPTWSGLASDRLLQRHLLSAHGLPQPALHGLYHPARACPVGVALRTYEALGAWLRDGARWPVFAKPAALVDHPARALLTGYDPGTDCLIRLGADPIATDAYARQIADRPADGFLFEQALSGDPALADRIGDKLSAIHLLVGNPAAGPEVLAATWQLPLSEVPDDRYDREDAMAAAIDPATGTVERLVNGWGGDLQTLRSHPVTGTALVDQPAPHWAAVCALVQRGAPIFPTWRVQQWTVALSEGGPTVLHAGLPSSLRVAQLAAAKGLFTEALERALRG